MTARILIIEDNAADMAFIDYLLHAFGCRTLQAADGEAGINWARRELPDLVICGINLPKLDGYDVMRKLKDDVMLQKLPVIGIPAQAMPDDREKVLAAGFDGYVARPIEAMSLIAGISAQLPGFQSARES